MLSWIPGQARNDKTLMILSLVNHRKPPSVLLAEVHGFRSMSQVHVSFTSGVFFSYNNATHELSMKQSQLFGKTLREAPKDETSANARYLAQAGYIDKLMAGVYSYLPLGLRVMKNIEGVIR